MALVSMRQLLDHAAEHGYGIPACNVNNQDRVGLAPGAARGKTQNESGIEDR